MFDVVSSDLPKQESFDTVSNFYAIDSEDLQVEKELFKNVDRNSAVKCKTVCQVVEQMHLLSLNEILPHFSKVCQILATIPATSCSAERSFSCLRRLKTYTRATMGGERFNSLAIINIERQFANAVDMDAVIDVFARRHGRAKYFF